MNGKLLGRAANWGGGCGCPDCGNHGRDRRSQRFRERRAWRRDLDSL